jgi:ketosteroid isomerase-like protein
MNKRLVVSALAKRRVPDPVFENGETALSAQTGPPAPATRTETRSDWQGGTEVLRCQPDGSWLCVIDNPWGTATE